MEQETKRAIKKLVLELRRVLEDDLMVVLKRYGIFTDKAWLDVDEIPKVTDDIRETRVRLEAAMMPEVERGSKKPKAAQLYVREAGFTHLNRLVGLKVLEVRGLITEVIQARDKYGGRSLYQRDYRNAHPEEATQKDDALPGALEAICREVATQIKFVFDVESESSILWPRYAALKMAIDLINELPAEVWQEDEIIGWIYQFYNAEEKEAIRMRGKPTLPIEVAVINQFFTPRWVVKFLVDNTLGRLWVEMHPDSERVRAKCDYLVPEPLPKDEDQDTDEEKITLDPDSPINNPDAKPRRDPKRPQDLKLIDPACGTMHFGHYAFEVFQEIYRDARERSWVDQEDAIEDKEVPLAILQRNLYGVDIDLRAVQLAALSMYVKARTAQREAGMSAGEAAKLPWQVNLVSADAHLTDGGMREAFLEEYADDPQLQKVWKEMFSEMEDIAQVGSLLRVEERFKQLLEAYQPPSVEDLSKEEQADLPGMEKSVRQMQLGEADRTGTWSPGRKVQRMLADLKAFASEALLEEDVNAQIFATEAEKALGLLDVLMQRYDVLVMNPPYGATTNRAADYLRELYPSTSNDIYAAFINQSLSLVGLCHGYIGALTSRTFMRLKSFLGLRELILNSCDLLSLIECGLDVLDDATVRPAAYIIHAKAKSRKVNRRGIFFQLREDNDRNYLLQKALDQLRTGNLEDYVFVSSRDIFKALPLSVFSYWVTDRMAKLFLKYPSLDSDVGYLENDRGKIADVKAGLCTGKDDLFVRYRWEIKDTKEKWVKFYKGGGFARYSQDIQHYVNWENNGILLKNSYGQLGLRGTRVQNEGFYFREGLIYPYISEKGLSARYLEEGLIFSHSVRGIFPKEKQNIWPLVGGLNSLPIEGLLLSLTVDRAHETGMVASLPIVDLGNVGWEDVGIRAELIYRIKKVWASGSELDSGFTAPWIDQYINGELIAALEPFLSKIPEMPPEIQGEINITDNGHDNVSGNLTESINKLISLERRLDNNVQALHDQIDCIMFDIYSLSIRDRKLIESELGEVEKEHVWQEMIGKSPQEKASEFVRTLVSSIILKAISKDTEGIISFQNGEKPDLVTQIRIGLISPFGEENLLGIEREISKYLNQSLEKWIDGPFIKWHTKLYKRRPIIWQITSPKRAFSCLVHYHKLNRDTLVSVRTIYLWRLRDRLKAELETARIDKDHKKVSEIEDQLEDLEILDQKLEAILASGWAVDFDAGVKSNILPLQEAGVLRYNNLV